jgi:putative nucleotidyltransferase with HDIG domain
MNQVKGSALNKNLMEKIQDMLDKMDVLPMSPSLFPRLLPILSDVDGNFDEVVEIISMEQSLTAKLLQICNSAFFGQSEPVSTVAEAVSRVGYQSVYLLVAMLNGSNCFPWPSPKGVDAAKMWRHSIISAFNARFVAETVGLDGNLLFTAGLLHDLGKVVLCQVPTTGHPVNFYIPSTAATLAAEKSSYGFTHPEVGASLLERWKLPAQLAISVRFHHDPRSAKGFEAIAACVGVGDLVTHIESHPNVLESPEFADVMDLLKLDLTDVRKWREKLRDSQGLVDSMSQLPL